MQFKVTQGPGFSAPSDLLLDVVRLINVLTYLLTYLPIES